MRKPLVEQTSSNQFENHNSISYYKERVEVEVKSPNVLEVTLILITDGVPEQRRKFNIHKDRDVEDIRKKAE